MVKIINEEAVGYTWAICTKCGKMYSYFDKQGKYNDDFPRIMCPTCKANSTKKKNKTGRGTPEAFLKEKGVTDKDIIKEFKAIFKRNTKRTYECILKDAIEISGYRKAEVVDN